MDILVFTILIILLFVGERYTTNKLYGDCKDIKCEDCKNKNTCKFDNEV